MINMIKWGLLSLVFALVTVSCSDDKEDPKPVSPLAGTWKLDPNAGALAVGPSASDLSWWSLNSGDVTTRACLMDDEYILNEDGTFQNSVGTSTWLESWQGVSNEGCGAPIAPHNGSVTGTWQAGTSTISVVGSGCYMGLAKVHNTGEDGSPDNNTIVYNYALSSDKNTLELTIKGWLADVPDATWYFRFVRQ